MPDKALPNTSRFERLKAKFPCYRSKAKAKAHATPSQAPPVDDASKRTDKREESPETVLAAPEDQVLDSNNPGNASAVPDDQGLGPNDQQPAPGSLWDKAFQELPEKSQQQLESMGAYKSHQAPLENDIRDIMVNVKEKQKQCEQKGFTIDVDGHQILIRDYAAKSITWLQKAGDIGIQFAPSQAAGPWAVVKAVSQVRLLLLATSVGANMKQVAVTYNTQMHAVLGTVEKVLQIIYRGRIYELVYTAERTAEEILTMLHDALLKLYKTALRMLVYSANIFKSSTGSNILEAVFHPDKSTNIFSEISSNETDLANAAQACESQRSSDADQTLMTRLQELKAPLARIDSRVEESLDTMIENEFMKLLEWISPILYTTNHISVQSQRTADTGGWLLQNGNFRQWAESSSSCVLWLYGPPGFGKTFLTSRVIDHIKGNLEQSPNDEGFAFFYCNRNETDRTKPLSVLQSYVRQLSTNFKYPLHIQKSLKSRCKEARRKGSNLDFASCQGALLNSLNLYPKTTLVLDALDECDPSSRNNLMKALDSLLHDAKMPVKIFIASRPDEDIRNRFSSRPNIVIEERDNQDDIEKYIKQRLPELAESNSALLQLQTKITKTLVDRCQGMFQWTFLQLEQLKKCRSKEAIETRLGQLPKHLIDAYDEIYKNIDKEDRAIADRAFMWVMCAKEPLESATILEAIRIDSTKEKFELASSITEDSLLSICSNLLVIDSASGTWKVSHLSVAEYFEQNRWSMQKADLHAVKSCLLLFLEAFASDEHVMEYYQTGKGFFLEYAMNCWPEHARVQEEEDQADYQSMIPLVKRFLGYSSEGSAYFQRYVAYVVGGYEIKLIASPLSAVCTYGLYYTLGDWWEYSEIDHWQGASDIESPLTLAAISNSVPLCRKLVQRGEIVNTQDIGGDGSALAAAAFQGNLEVVKFLCLEAGADVDLLLNGAHHGSALAAAAFQGHLEMVKFLCLEAGADVNLLLTDVYGSALAAAAFQGNLEIVKFLCLEAGADVDLLLNGAHCGSALAAAAAAKGNLEIVKFLCLEAGADVNLLLTDIYGSALAAAAFRGSLEIVKFLCLEAGADVNLLLKSSFGSALAAAAFQGNLEIVKFLLDAGANMDLPLENGRYGLFDIAEYHNYLETVSGGSDTDWHHGIMTHKPCPR